MVRLFVWQMKWERNCRKKEQNALMKLLHISERKFWMKKESWTGQSFQTLFLPTGLNFLY